MESKGNARRKRKISSDPSPVEFEGFEAAYTTKKVVEEPRQMGGRTIYKARDGRVMVVDRVSLCDVCSNPDMEKQHICHKCARKICDDCWVRFKGIHLCIECLMLQEPLVKNEFKVLLAVVQGISNTDKIARAVRTRKEEIQMAMRRLCGNGLIMLEGGLFSRKYVLTEKGEEILEAYQKVYGTGFDIFTFNNRLRE